MAGLRPTEADVRMGARLHEARRAAGLTQRTVAAAIGVSAAQLQKYEKGTNRLSATSLPVIAELTGKPVAWFFGEAVAPRASLIDSGTEDGARALLGKIANLVDEFGAAGDVAAAAGHLAREHLGQAA